MRFAEVKKILEDKGYFFNRTKGSHHIFIKAGVGAYSVPVHRGKVKPVYVKQIQKLEG